MNAKTKLFTITTLLLLAVLVLVPAASAFDGRAADRVIIGKDEVINDDLYLGGSEVVVEGTINGDLMAAGEVVIINGSVSGDLWVAGNSVVVNGTVGDDLFAAATAVTLGPNASVADDVFSAGASVESKAGSQVGGDFLIGAYQALVSGQITEDLLAGANRLRLEGQVAGGAQVAVDTGENDFTPDRWNLGNDAPAMPYVPAGLSFGSAANVAGTLVYTSPDEQNVPASVTTQVEYRLPPVDAQISREINPSDGPDSWLLRGLRRMISLLLVGLLIAYLAPAWIRNPAAKLQARPWPSLGVGLAGLIVAPFVLLFGLIVVVLLAILMGALTLGELVGVILSVGLPGLTLVAILFYLALGYLPQAAVAYLGGRWIVQRMRPEADEKIYWPLLVGLLILGLLLAIPGLGGVLEFVIVMLGLGAICLLIWERRSRAAAVTA